MGVCASTQTSNSKEGGIGTVGEVDYSSIKVIHMDGLMEEFSDPIKAAKITSRNPNFFLCNSEQMFIGDSLPMLSDDDPLQLGQIYFLLPLSLAHNPLSLPDLCTFAIKATSALRTHAPPFFT